ncbi:MAG: cysteine desulfurase family protein [Candidatus Pacebacteria bacterium]|nr:cysteine desulfurase family protein [Candidatus Paceibacterota bacterium]
MKKIYLDNAATTPVDKKVISSMKKYWRSDFANPSSIHSMGVEAKRILNSSREKVSYFLNAHSREIYFTSSGTESNNLAILGVAKKTKEFFPRPHLITTEIEHSSILECFKELSDNGFDVDYLKVDENGLVDPKDIRNLIKNETVLVSIGYANSEIGVIQPIKDIIKEIRYKRKELNRGKVGYPYLHIDASQATQYLNMNVEELGVDLVTLDAQKIYGPKGIGALFVRDGIKISPITFGGGQESGMRGGTENLSLIVGFAKSLEIINKNKDKVSERLLKLRDWFFNEIKKEIPEIVINGSIKERLPNNINISMIGFDGEMLVLRLDEMGIICSSSSACASGAGESVVVRKISEKKENNVEYIQKRAKATLRFTMGNDTKKRHLKKALKYLLKIRNNYRR